jgi:hypothetical protein
MAKTSVPCDACGKPVFRSDDFCEACGGRVDSATKQRLTAAIQARRDEREAREAEEQQLGAQRQGRVRKASQMIGILAVLFLLGGILQGFMAKGVADKALQNLAQYAATDTVTIEGVEHNVGALRAQVENEPTMLFAVNLTLTAIFIGLFLWARRSPFPAIITAFAVFVVVHFVNFLIDPSTILQGLFIKAIGVTILVAGIKAAVADRASQRTAPG